MTKKPAKPATPTPPKPRKYIPTKCPKDDTPDAWGEAFAETIKRPQEIWRLKLAMSEELYLFGRFQRGSERIDTVAVFKRGRGDDQWNEGKTAYTFDRVNGLDEKRESIVRRKACVQWVEV